MTEEAASYDVTDRPTTLIDTFEEKEFPAVMDLWRIAVQIPTPPETSEGGIYIPDEKRSEQEFSTYVGMVRSMGPLCYTAVTRSKMDLHEGAIKCVKGDWVLFGKHAGERFRTMDGTLWVVLSDTEILGVTRRPHLFDCMSL